MKVFLRATSNDAGKHRPDWFSYEACFNTLYSQVPGGELTVFFDGTPETVPKYISDAGANVIFCEDGGSETKSFRSLMKFLQKQEYPDDEIVYIVEDDYLHRPGAIKTLQDVFENSNVDYATLYDHMDKYFPGYFEKFAYGFRTVLIPIKSCHWRTTPSTTNTFAVRYKTLMEDMDVQMKFSPETERTSRDHLKFHALWEKSRTLVSSIPGLSTHVENELMSPCFDWAGLSNSSLLSKASALSSDSSLSVDALDDPVPETCA